MTQGNELSFDRSFVAPQGEMIEVSPRVRRILAANPGPMTFSGTCTYIVGRGDVAVIDPGPDSPDHIAALLHALRHERVRHILVTHTHRDHCGAAAAVKTATGAPIVGCAPHIAPARPESVVDAAHEATYAPDAVMADGDVVAGAGYVLEAVATPGHTRNHLAFSLAEEAAFFSGDHVMAWATSVVIPPDGAMAAYMASLTRLAARDDRIYWPGHGNAVRDPQRYVAALIRHRRSREAQILSALAAGAMTVPALVAQIYVDLDPALVPAARLSVLAHLEDLAGQGRVRCEPGGSEMSADPVFRRL